MTLRNLTVHHIGLAKTSLFLSGGEKAEIEIVDYLNRHEREVRNIIYTSESGKILYGRLKKFKDENFTVIGKIFLEKRFGEIVAYYLRIPELFFHLKKFVTKDIYEKIGGFDERITAGEDYDFQNKLNRGEFRTGFIDAEALHLGEPTNFWKHMMKYYAYGKDFVNYRKNNPNESKKQLGFFRGVYLKNWRKFFSHPSLGTGFFIYNIFKFSFGFFGFIAGIIHSSRQ